MRRVIFGYLLVPIACILLASCSAGKSNLPEAQFKGAGEAGKEAEPKDPVRAEAEKYYFEGMMSMNHGHLGKAEEKLLKAVELYPTYNNRMMLAKLYEKKKVSTAAIEQYREAAKLNPGEPAPHNGIIGGYLKMNLLDYAINAGEQAIKDGIAPEFVANNLGWAYYKKGNLDKAQEYLTLAKEKIYDSAPLNNLGLVLVTKGEYDEALKNFREAETLNPASTLTPYFKAVAYMKSGREQEAVEALKEGLGKDPQLAEKLPGYGALFFPMVQVNQEIAVLMEKAKSGGDAS